MPTVITIPLNNNMIIDIDETGNNEQAKNVTAPFFDQEYYVSHEEIEAMKQMVHEIIHSPELFYECAPIYVKSFLASTHNQQTTVEPSSQECGHQRRKLQRRGRFHKRRVTQSPPPLRRSREAISPKIVASLPPMPFH